MSYNLKVQEFDLKEKENYFPYTAVSEGWIDKLYDQNSNYVCERDTYNGTTTCTAEGEFISLPDHFKALYLIEWDKVSDSGLFASVLDSWAHDTKPVMIGTLYSNYPYNNDQTRVQNITPKDDWYLFFGTNEAAESSITIADWSSKTTEEQATFLKEAKANPDLNKVPATTKTTNTGTTGLLGNLRSLFTSTSSTTGTAKTGTLWIVLAAILGIVVFVVIWAVRKTKKKAEVAAMKYGKYSQNVADALT